MKHVVCYQQTQTPFEISRQLCSPFPFHVRPLPCVVFCLYKLVRFSARDSTPGLLRESQVGSQRAGINTSCGLHQVTPPVVDWGCHLLRLIGVAVDPWDRVGVSFLGALQFHKWISKRLCEFDHPYSPTCLPDISAQIYKSSLITQFCVIGLK